MDREVMTQFLDAGLSLDQIAERTDLHPSTVGYWVHKFGLRPVHADRHQSRGGLTREQLEPLVIEGASVAQVADTLGRSKATVRHWLRRYDLKTRGAAGRPRQPKAAPGATREIQMTCTSHGNTVFALEGRGYYRCKRCRGEAVVRRRRKVKTLLLMEAGGRCTLCGYDRCAAALQFHHLDPAEKRFAIAYGGMARAIEVMRGEAQKCILLCSNCHAEVEAGAASLPP